MNNPNDDLEYSRLLISRIQLHSSAKSWDGIFVPAPPYEQRLPNLFENVNKPNYGFWTSSEKEDGRSSWLDVCSNPDINRKPVEVHRFQIIETPRILILRRDYQITELAFKWNLISSYLTDLGRDENWRDWCDDAGFCQSLDEYVDKKLVNLLDNGEFWGTAAYHYDAVHTPYDAAYNDKWIDSFEVEGTFWFQPQAFLQHLGKTQI